MARKELPDGKPPVPESMTTFADMITLMLTFFILLCTFAETQNAEYFASGVGSFRRAIETMGLPGILPSSSEPDLMEPRIEHRLSREPGSEEFWEEVDDRLLEENPEVVRDALIRSLKVKHHVVIPSGIRFSNRSTDLPGDAPQQARRLIDSIEGLDLEVEVIAFAAGEGEPLRGTIGIALERAQAVARLLAERAGLDEERVRYSGLKLPVGRPTMEETGDEVLLRLVRPAR